MKKKKYRNQDDPEVMCMGEIDYTVYKQGMKACESGKKANNPYKPNTLKFYSWNKGWNAVD